MVEVRNPFPHERQAKRQHLLDAVDSVAEVVAAHRDETELGRTLAPPVVDALRDAGLFRMKAPREVGGAETHPVDQMDVIEALALIDPAASWCMLISSAVSGGALARLPERGVEEILDGGFPCMAGSLKPGGRATRAEGGYRVSGRWAWGSGVPHADYVSVPVLAADGPTPLVGAVVPTTSVILHDNWHAMGMKGTGSGDYELDDVFVPDHLISDLAGSTHQRGGALFRLGLPGYVVNEHGAFPYALGRLALATVVDTAVAKKRGYGAGTSLADREVFQREVARGTQRMNACALLMADVIDRLFEAAVEGTPSPAIQAEARAAAVWVTDEALDVVATLFRYAGGSAVMADSTMQRILRDLYTVQSHLVVSDVAYEVHGRVILGMDEDAVMR